MGFLGNMMADATGAADIGKIMHTPEQLSGCMAPHFLLPTDGKPYFVIKTKQDEYCFTGKVLLHCDGTSATSTKRLCKRFLWYNNKLADVMFETAGKIDRDCAIKFTLGGRACSIDVAKDEADLLVPVYQALSSLAEQQMLNEIMSQHARDALNASEAIRPQNLYLGQGVAPDSVAQMQLSIADQQFQWRLKKWQEFSLWEYDHIFSKFPIK